jgi:AraC-like DNA-binding protein
LAKQFISQYRQSVSPVAEVQEKQNLIWLNSFLRVFLGFQGVWLVFLVFYILPVYRDRLMATVSYFPVIIPLAILIYWLGLKGYLHTKSSGQNPATAKTKTNKVAVPAVTVENTIVALRKAMEEDQLYLDPELNLDKIVAYSGIDQKTISYVLNQHLLQSFNTFVNSYRIKAVKQRLRENPSSHLTLTGIAFECGFNSQATFQRTFKQFTQLTPSAYISAQENT